ncbi:MAG TPA: peptidylprolyl isomerase [Pyrinomonadaceae bacterium]|nr:peptidylprolyl isomerase [Pyrinomonadaceae bacterium]
MSFRKALLASLALSVISSAAFAQRAKPRGPASPRPAAAAPAAGVNLTAQDMALVVDGLGFPPEVRSRLAADAEERKAFARDVRQMLALAEEAKAAGYAARPGLKLQLELSRSFVLAQTYFKSREQGGANSPDEVAPPAEVEAFFKEPATPAQFEAFLEDYRVNGPNKGKPLTDEQRAELRQHYGRVMLGKRRAVAAGLDRQRRTQLVVMLQQARLLAGAYSKEIGAKFKAEEAEVDAYVAAHPQYDTKPQRAKSEDILRRARAGENFEALANEFTEDPSGKGTGGDLGWFGRGQMVKPFEEAAFTLKAGEVGGVVETQFGFHVIKVEERRAAGEGEQVRARHILIRYNPALRPGRGAPASPREQARAAVEEEKRHRVFDEIANRQRVFVAEDFELGAPGAVTSSAAGDKQLKPGAQPPAPPAGRGTTPRPAPTKPKTGAARPGRGR